MYTPLVSSACGQVRAAYPVPHNETDEEVAIDMQYEQHMSRLHQAVNPADVVLGWLASMHAMHCSLRHHDMVCLVSHKLNGNPCTYMHPCAYLHAL